MTATISPKCLTYLRGLNLPEDAPLRLAREAAESTGLPIHISPERGAFLHLLVTLLRPRHIVEIGCFTGYSALWMARALPDAGRITTLEHTAAHATLARHSFAAAPYSDRIALVEGEALEQLQTHPQLAACDMVFIDADKRQYPDYLAWAIAALQPGGLLVADNTLLSGAVYQESLPRRVRASTRDIMRHFNQQLAEHPDFTSLLLPLDDGLTLALKHAPSKF